MGAPFIEWMVGQAGLAGLAAFALWMLKQSYEERLSAEQRHREEMRRLYEETRQSLEGNTQALTAAIEHLRQAVKCPIFLTPEESKEWLRLLGGRSGE